MVHIQEIESIFRVDIQLYGHVWKLGKREIVWKYDELNCLSGVVNNSLSVGRW